MSNIAYMPPQKEKAKPKKQGKKHNLKRSRALRRKGFEFQPFDSEHIPYAWAAYKRGCFKEVGDIPEDMDASAFSAWIVNWIWASQFEAVTFLAKTPDHGVIPVGIVVIQYLGQIALPHAVWFNEASARNRVETSLAFLVELKKRFDVLITARGKNRRFFLHLCDYGVLRKVGLLKEWVEGESTTLFQTVGH